jgi:hypothetical protein
MHYKAMSAMLNPVFTCTVFIRSSQRVRADHDH